MKNPIVCVVFIASTGFLVVLFQGVQGPCRPNINLQSYSLLQEGMTEEKVEQILGCPAGAYFRGSVFFHADLGLSPAISFVGTASDARPLTFFPPHNERSLMYTKVWLSDRCGIWLGFENHILVCKLVHDVTPLPEESLLNRTLEVFSK